MGYETARYDMGVGFSPDELVSAIDSGAIVLDIRPLAEFMAGHVKGAANARCGSMQQKQIIMAKMPRNSRIIIIDADGQASGQNAEMMAQFGFDAHYLEGGMNAWSGEIVSTKLSPLTSGGELHSQLDQDIFLLDVREPEEFANHKISGAVNVPLAKLFESGACDSFPKDKKIVTICSHGNRSMIATFALSKNGLESTSLDGGMSGWSQVLAQSTIYEKNGLKVIQVEKVGKGCLSYIVGSDGKAVVIDALHPVRRYKEIADAENLEIIAVADTHCHADHVSGARELASALNAKLHLSNGENYDINCVKVGDGDTISFGSKEFSVMGIPGHTVGSVAYTLDEIAFCGDTVFADGLGRPDLHDTATESANFLYDTLHTRLNRLAETVKIFPAHHAEDTKKDSEGSYGISISQLKSVPMFGINKEEFVSKITQGIPAKPPNYSMIIKFNRGSMPLNPMMIPDLESGPNRCAVRTDSS